MVVCLFIVCLIFASCLVLLDHSATQIVLKSTYMQGVFAKAKKHNFSDYIYMLINQIPRLPFVPLLLRLDIFAKSIGVLHRSFSWVLPSTSQEKLLSALIYQTALAATLGALVLKGVLAAIVTPACLLAIELLCAEKYKAAQQAKIKEAIPDTVRSLSSCMSAGLSLAESLAVLSQEAPPELRPYFFQASCAFEQGHGSREALSHLNNAQCKELSYLALALNIQHKTGGNMQGVLRAVLESTTAQIELEQSQRAQTAQAQLSARLVYSMPFVLLILFSAISPGFLDGFTESLLGILVFILALAMQGAGMFIIHKLIHGRA